MSENVVIWQLYNQCIVDTEPAVQLRFAFSQLFDSGENVALAVQFGMNSAISLLNKKILVYSSSGFSQNNES